MALKIPVLSTMDRYLLAELSAPFLFGVGAFTSVSISVGTLFDLVRRVVEEGLPLAIATQVFFLQLPYFLSLALPMAILLASLMAYSRLSSDSELVALRSCGVSIRRLILPALLFSIGVTGLTFALNELVVPEANYQATLTLERTLKDKVIGFQRNNVFYPEYTKVKTADGQKRTVLSRLFYAERFDGERMYGLTIIDRSQTGIHQIISAESAIWESAGSAWSFVNGTIYVISSNRSYQNIIHFKQQQLQLSRAPFDLARRNRDYGEMSIAQAQEYLQVLHQSGDDERIRKLRVRIQQKYAFPFVCSVFGIAGAALGTRPQRTGRATSFGLSVLIIFAYYLVAFLCSSLGQLAILSPFWSGWLPNFLGWSTGIFLLIRASR